MKTTYKNYVLGSIFLLVVFSVLLFSCETIKKTSYDPENDFEIEIQGNEITITKYIGSKQTVRIPPRIQGLPVTSIGSWAFYRCTSLTSIIIPNSVTSIGEAALVCTSLTAINVDSGNANYNSNQGVLYNKNKTFLHTYPAGKKSSTFTIPDSVTTIGDSAFYSCTSLTNVSIPDSVTSIGENVFTDCTGLTAITVNAVNTEYSSQDDILYNKNKTTLIKYPQGKTGSAFTIPNSVSSIGERAFYGCNNLTSVTISINVTSIGKGAFAFCTELTSVTIPGNVKNIEDWAFYKCTWLTSVTIQGTIPASNFSNDSTFPGDLRSKYLAGGMGTYTREENGNTWTRQP